MSKKTGLTFSCIILGIVTLLAGVLAVYPSSGTTVEKKQSTPVVSSPSDDPFSFAETFSGLQEEDQVTVNIDRPARKFESKVRDLRTALEEAFGPSSD